MYKPIMAIPFVGQRMSREEFKNYLESLQFSSFRPSFVTLHHTAIPSLADRPQGFSAQHLRNLLSYYQNTMKWSGAPHVFIDDQGDGIIVFQRMDRRGIHAASFNNKSWGVEMLGHYDIENFDSGRGKTVRDNTMQALAIMCECLNAKPETIKFHRDDPKTTKTCPGNKVQKSYVVNAVQQIIDGSDANENAEEYTDWTVKFEGRPDWTNTRVTNGFVIAKAKDFLSYLSPGSTLKMVSKSTIEWTAGTKTVQIPVRDIDENNRSWVSVRQAAEAIGLTIQVTDKTIHIK
jgi:hypothetical protein